MAARPSSFAPSAWPAPACRPSPRPHARRPAGSPRRPAAAPRAAGDGRRPAQRGLGQPQRLMLLPQRHQALLRRHALLGAGRPVPASARAAERRQRGGAGRRLDQRRHRGGCGLPPPAEQRRRRRRPPARRSPAPGQGSGQRDAGTVRGRAQRMQQRTAPRAHSHTRGRAAPAPPPPRRRAAGSAWPAVAERGELARGDLGDHGATQAGACIAASSITGTGTPGTRRPAGRGSPACMSPNPGPRPGMRRRRPVARSARGSAARSWMVGVKRPMIASSGNPAGTSTPSAPSATISPTAPTRWRRRRSPSARLQDHQRHALEARGSTSRSAQAYSASSPAAACTGGSTAPPAAAARRRPAPRARRCARHIRPARRGDHRGQPVDALLRVEPAEEEHPQRSLPRRARSSASATRPAASRSPARCGRGKPCRAAGPADAPAAQLVRDHQHPVIGVLIGGQRVRVAMWLAPGRALHQVQRAEHLGAQPAQRRDQSVGRRRHGC